MLSCGQSEKAKCDKIIEGLTILRKYEAITIWIQDGRIFGGLINMDAVSSSDADKLRELDWFISEQSVCWGTTT